MRSELAQLSDEAVLTFVARGDEGAVAELYDRYGRVAYGLAVRILRNEELAEDAVQDAFLTVWRSAHSFRAERAKARTWILTIVHRRAVDLVRREARRAAEPIEAAPTDLRESAEEEASLRSRRRVVQHALRRLSPEQREALELAYYGGLTQSEIAERLGEPLGTVKSRMFAALARLRELVADADVSELRPARKEGRPFGRPVTREKSE